MKLFHQPLIRYFELAARIYTAIFLSIYGLGKISGGQFFRHGKIPATIGQTPLADIGGFELAWTFFGYSELYIWFIGGSQLLGSALLLFERTKLLGIAILLPILANIIVVDYCFGIPAGALYAAILYLCALLFVLYCNRERLVNILKIMLSKPDEHLSMQATLIRWGSAILLLGAFFMLERGMLNLLNGG